VVLEASGEELAAHAARMARIEKKSGGKLLWVETADLPSEAALAP
jgi:hypothetical protein